MYRLFLGAVLAVIVLPPPAAADAKSSERISAESRKVIQWAKRTYNVEVIYEKVPYPIRGGGTVVEGSNPSVERVDQYLHLLKAELARYPPALVLRARLYRVVLSGAPLHVNGKRVAGVTHMDSRSYCVDVDYAHQNPRGARKTFHHEMYHLIDWTMQGAMFDKDIAWARLNPRGFTYRYGSGMAAPTNRENSSAKRDDLDGFLSGYSQTSVQEDKAEVFGWMFADWNFVAERMKDDKVVRAKVQLMQKRLAVFCQAMNKKYWDRLARDAGADDR